MEDQRPVKDQTAQPHEVVDKFGNKATIYARPATKKMRDHAIIVAAQDYKKATGEIGGISFGVFDKEMVCAMVPRWEGLPMPVKQTWDLISPEMGDAIVSTLKIRDLMKGAVEGAGVEAAKNSSGLSSEGPESGPKE